MPIPFFSKMDLPSAIRKTMMGELRIALNALSLSKGLDKDRFKQARKSIKRVRAVFRLIESGIDPVSRNREDQTLKSISKVFKGVRDVGVAQEVFFKFQKTRLVLDSKVDIEPIQTRLSEVHDGTIQKKFSEEEVLRQTIADLQAGMERADEIPLSSITFKTVEEGLKATYRSVLSAYREATKNPDELAFFEFRKEVKFLCIQFDLLTEYCSDSILEWTKSLNAISDQLGEFQDLALIREMIEEDASSYGDKKNTKQFLELLEARLDELNGEILKAAKPVFARKPKEFVDWIESNAKNWK